MIPVFVINLRQDPEKYARLSAALQKYAFVQLRRIDAVTGSTLPDQLCFTLSGDPAMARNKGALGCTLSHLRAWETLLAGPHEWAIILEDDAIPADWSDLPDIAFPPDFDVIFANNRTALASPPAQGRSLTKLHESLRAIEQRAQSVGTDCYVISRAGAQKLITALREDWYAGHLDFRMLAYCVALHEATEILRESYVLENIRMHTKRTPMLNHAVLSPSLVTHRPEAETSRTREDRLGITAAGGSAPAPEISRVETIEIEPMGNLGNRMIQYLAARHLQSACPGSRILRANLPELNIEQADEAPDPGGPLFTLRLEPGVDFAAMVERVVAGGYRRVRIADHMQRLDYLPDAATSAKIFPDFDVPFQKTSAHELLIDIRAAEFDQGSGHAPLVPVAFYERLVDLSGLSPVFIGRIGQNAYAQALRHTFPQARFIDNQDALADFQTIRSAEHIVVSPSSLCWLAARLSQAEQIFVPVIGFLNPMHSTATATDVLPSDDPRYRFFIFPLHYGVPEQQALPYHADLSRLCREISADQVAFLRRHTPILHVAEPIDDIDARWYCNQYQDAALEIAQGWYAGAAAHYAGIGRQRGYKPMPAGFSYTAQVPAGLVDHALGGAARQSSMSSSSIGATALEDAARAVQGIVQNPYAFHTGWENGPWWDVDLGAVRSITHVVIHNRTEDDGIIGRATPLSASISFDGDIWLPLFVTPDALIFGLQGRKLVWQSPEVVKTRFLRLSVARITCFHLRQVQVFGPP